MRASLLVAATGFMVLESALVQSFVSPAIRHLPTRKTDGTTSRFASVVDAGIDLANQVQPSIALVTPMGVRKMKTRGSGFVVDFLNTHSENDEYTYLITAAHVAAPGFDIGLAFPGDTEDRPAVVLGRNQSLDLALLRIDKVENRTSLEVSGDLPPVGTTTFAHGYPASRMRGPAMTSGIVCGIADGLGLPDDFKDNSAGKNATSTTNKDSTTFVVTDAAMSGGMSGGPLTDATGNVLGVNALIRPDLRALGNYAVSAEEVFSFLNRLAEDATTTNIDTTETIFQVLLFNDPMNKKQRVSGVLEGVANMKGEEANKVMMEAHTTGTGVIGVFENRSQAEYLCQALRQEDLLVEVQ